MTKKCENYEKNSYFSLFVAKVKSQRFLRFFCYFWLPLLIKINNIKIASTTI